PALRAGCRPLFLTDMPEAANPRPTRLTEISPQSHPLDKGRVRAAIRELLTAIGEDPQREGLRETPRRIAEMYEEIFAGLGTDPAEIMTVTFDEGYDEMVILRDIPFYSICEHHL